MVLKSVILRDSSDKRNNLVNNVKPLVKKVIKKKDDFCRMSFSLESLFI